MNILEISDNLYLVDLPLKLPGFRKFISTWVLKEDGKGVVIDVGPSATVEKLMESLRYLGVSDVEYVLLTHIHLDHAGGLAEFLSNFPEARVVVHEKGVRHLVKPDRLWESSKNALGKIADAYGRPVPVKEDRIADAGAELEFYGYDIKIIKTPGHAPHHQSYVIDEFLFAGEASGVHMPLKNDYYLRPATPHRFIYEIAANSIEKLKEIGKKRMCFAHFGFKRDSVEILEKAEEQLNLWVSVVYDVACRRDFEDKDRIVEEARKELLERDRRFSRYVLLDDDVKKREDFFINNSLHGIVEYIFQSYCEP